MMAAILVLAALLSLFFSGVYSGLEIGIYRVNRLRLKLLGDQGVPLARTLQRALGDEHRAISVTLIGTNIANYLTTIFVALLMERQFHLTEGQIEFYATVMVTPLIFVFGEVLPKNLFQRDPDRLTYRVADLLWISRCAFSPATWVIRSLRNRTLALLGEHHAGGAEIDQRRQIAVLLREALAEYTDAEDHADRHGEFVERVLELSSISVGKVMVPEARVARIPENADRAIVLEFARRHEHSRFPVYSAHPSQIVGVVNVHTLLADTSWKQVGDLKADLPRVPVDESVASAILRLQRAGAPMAAVVHPGGRFAGILTLKDLLEEIVGELGAW